MNNSIYSQSTLGKRNCQAGFTLTEFLMASLILLIVASAIFKLLSEMQRTASYQAEVQSVLNNTRIAMKTVERYFRQAGNDPLKSGLPGITIFSATEVQIRSDRTGSSGENKGDPDGDIDDSGENVTIRYNRKSQSLEVVPHGGPAQIIANYISDLTIRYYNADGDLTTSGNEVRTVTITISGSTLQPDPETHLVFGVMISENVMILT